MHIRNARKSDFEEIIHVAKEYNLDYESMEEDKFFVLEARKRVVGICGLRKHHDCFELCSLGIKENFRKRGLGKRLVLALLKNIENEIYLSTVIPVFFKKLGFVQTDNFPDSMKKNKDWCFGCSNKEACVVMVRKN